MPRGMSLAIPHWILCPARLVALWKVGRVYRIDAILPDMHRESPVSAADPAHPEVPADRTRQILFDSNPAPRLEISL